MRGPLPRNRPSGLMKREMHGFSEARCLGGLASRCYQVGSKGRGMR